MIFSYLKVSELMPMNMVKVKRCPKNEYEWKKRESKIKCRKILRKDFYHCVLNLDGTGLVEVCAPSVNITGKSFAS